MRVHALQTDDRKIDRAYPIAVIEHSCERASERAARPTTSHDHGTRCVRGREYGPNGVHACAHVSPRVTSACNRNVARKLMRYKSEATRSRHTPKHLHLLTRGTIKRDGCTNTGGGPREFTDGFSSTIRSLANRGRISTVRIPSNRRSTIHRERSVRDSNAENKFAMGRTGESCTRRVQFQRNPCP